VALVLVKDRLASIGLMIDHLTSERASITSIPDIEYSIFDLCLHEKTLMPFLLAQ